jgi:carbon monoxide dehydrogenase subunit G
MKLTGEQKINAPRETVFAALNDTQVLQKSIPGCEEIEKISDTQMTATVSLKVGPVKAKFKGSVELSNLNPPESYTISGEGKAGPAGSARGGADVVLNQDGENTILHYDVSANVMGKFAQLGNRLIDSTAKKLAGQFFENFGAIVEAQSEPETDPQPVEPTQPVSKTSFLNKPVFWAAFACLAAVILIVQLA